MTGPLVLLVAALLGACSVVPAVSPSPSSAFVTPEPTRLDTLAPDDLRVFAVGPIPPDARFVFAGAAGAERLILVDPGARRVVVAAQFEGMGSFWRGRGGDISATADRRTVVLTISDSDRTRAYLIRPEDGSVFSFTLPAAKSPRVSPDGARIAFARESSDAATNGVWMADSSGGHAERVVPADRRASVPVQWSGDGRYLSLAASDGRVGLYDTVARTTRLLGSGSSPRWRGDELYYASGASVVAYDAATDRTRAVYTAREGVHVGRLEVRRGDGAIASIETAPGGDPQLWLRDGIETRALRKSDNVIALWWSDDGSHLYVWDSVEATTTIRDAFTGGRLVDFCLRGGLSPPCS